MTTIEHLGIIDAVYVWLNFQCTSPWYCKQILVFDIFNNHWYRAEVKNWFTVPTLNTTKQEVHEYHPGGLFVSRGFINHFATELENTHHTTSIFTMHPRLLHTYEQRTVIFIVKVFTMGCWTWLSLELLFDVTIGKYMDPINDNRFILVMVVALSLAVILSLMSTLSVIPLESLYRVGHLSSIIQKSCTDPKRLVLAKESFASRSSRSSRRFSSIRPSLAPSVAFQKSSRGNFCSWNFFKAVFLSPCQFYNLNTHVAVLDYKMRHFNLIARSAAFIYLLVLYTTVVFILSGMSFTGDAYWSIYMMILTFVTDVLIVNPIFILIRSLVTFYLLKDPNKEIYILDEEAKITPPNVISHRQYLTKATGKYYKPLLSSEIERLKNMEIKKRFGLDLLFFILEGAAAVICLAILVKINGQFLFYGIRAMNELASPHEIKEQGAAFIDNGIQEVNGALSASTYIVNNFLHMRSKWYSGKLRTLDGKRWARDDNSMRLHSTSTIFILMSNIKTQRTPQFFNKYYNNSYGYLSEGVIYTKPVFVDETALYFNKMHHGTIRSKSYEYYAYEGSTLIRESTYQENAFILYVLEKLDLGASERPIRAMIVSVNYMNLFTKHLFCVDLLVEFNPSGIWSAVIKVNASIIELKSPYVVEFIILTFICISFLIIIVASLHNSYNDGLWRKFGVLIVSVIVLVVVYEDNDRRFEALERISYHSESNYMNIHPLHEKEQFTSRSLLLLPCFYILNNIIWISKSIIGISSFKIKLHKCVSFYLFSIIIGAAITMVYNPNLELVDYMMYYYCNHPNHIRDANKNIGVPVVTFISAILRKVCMALIVYQYMFGDMQFGMDSNSIIMRFIKTFNCYKPAKVESKKKSSHKSDGSMKERNSMIGKLRKVSPNLQGRIKGESPNLQGSDGHNSVSPDEVPPSAVQSLTSQISDVIRKKFGLFDR